MKKTKIVCSIGPASVNVNVMKQMVEAGMNVARINFSHGNYNENDIILNNIKEVRKLTGENIAILYDTKGPDFRTLDMQDGGVKLVKGNKIRIVMDEVIGNEERFSVNHREAFRDIKVGNIILLEDALMKLEVLSCEDDGITCTVIEGGILNSKKGVNVPGINLNLPFMSNQDRDDIEYACSHCGDFLALSFVESKDNVLEVRKLLKEFGREDMGIISKIESRRGVDNLDGIIDVSDGIMVARGDLGVEMPIQKLPIIQKNIICKCRDKEKSVIVATEMLASMYTSIRPTRAEVTDISNAVFDGTDAVMLSGESTIGKHPIEAVKYMASICEEAEKNQEYAFKFDNNKTKSITETIASAVLTSASSLMVKAIMVPTSGGHSAMIMSNMRPNPIIIALCHNKGIARRLSLNYGVYPRVCKYNENNMDEVVRLSKSEAKDFLGLKNKDIIIITGGIHDDPHIKQTNFLKIEEL